LYEAKRPEACDRIRLTLDRYFHVSMLLQQDAAAALYRSRRGRGQTAANM
jgi:molybdenum cofactor biosynthesis enzyme MoaA